MSVSRLEELVTQAKAIKPAFGDDCNSCGWCCITEVCAIGFSISGSNALPCQYLVNENGKHMCSLAVASDDIKAQIGAGTGCCAKTQDEVLAELFPNFHNPNGGRDAEH